MELIEETIRKLINSNLVVDAVNEDDLNDGRVIIKAVNGDDNYEVTFLALTECELRNFTPYVKLTFSVNGEDLYQDIPSHEVGYDLYLNAVRVKNGFEAKKRAERKAKELAETIERKKKLKKHIQYINSIL